jgi:acetoacetate decarboxylase
MSLFKYDSVYDYQTWDRANIKSIKMEPSLDDPWAELSVVKPIGAAYSKNSNRVLDAASKLADFHGDEADNLISYLLSGRWDRSIISGGGQRYGQF